MALTFSAKVRSPEVSYTAAQAEEIMLDIAGSRLAVRLVFGNMVQGKFVRDRAVPPVVRVVDNVDYSKGAGQVKAIQTFIWQLLKDAGYESGTEA